MDFLEFFINIDVAQSKVIERLNPIIELKDSNLKANVDGTVITLPQEQPSPPEYDGQIYFNGWKLVVWEEALKLNKRFDPAIQGIQSARYQIEMFQKIKESLMLD